MAEYLSDLNYKGKIYQYTDLGKASFFLGGDIEGLPYSIRILLESVLRKEDGVDKLFVMVVEGLSHHNRP